MTNSAVSRILRVDSSGRHEDSVTRQLTQAVVDRLVAANPGADVSTRDVATGFEFVDDAWIGANFTPADDRSREQTERLAVSEELVRELKSADVLVLGAPIYNFGIPAALKAYIDLICRARETFAYTENGPKGLLEGKKAYVVMASGGTEVGSDIDFASGYIRHVLGFIGITDVTFFSADQLMMAGEEKVKSIAANIDAAIAA